MDKVVFENTVLAILKARPGIGSLQLRKALIIADAVHNALYGQGITGAKYVKHRYGPVPDDEAFSTLLQMSFPCHKIDVREMVADYYTQNSYYLIDEPDYSVFTRSQIDIINYAANTVQKYPASLLSDMTHDDVYNNTAMGAEIPLDHICTVEISGFDTDHFTESEKDGVKAFFATDEALLFNFI